MLPRVPTPGVAILEPPERVGRIGIVAREWYSFFADFVRGVQVSSPIQCSVGGTATAIALTPTDARISTLEDGMEFEFVPAFTTTTAGVPTIEIVGVASAKTVKAPDAKTFALWGDIQKDMPTRVRYVAAANVFVLRNPPLPYKSSIFGNGKVKLQSDGATSISLTQDDGQALLLQNPDTLAMRLVACPTITNASLFTAVNNVEGVANQALANNQLYGVYAHNPTGTNDQDVRLEFWRLYTGVGSEAWTPIINEYGIYVKRASIGSGVADNSRTFVGPLWTGAGDISTVLTGSTALRSAVQSHYNPWLFPMMSDQVALTGFTSASNGVQNAPSATIVSYGIQMCPTFRVLCNVRNNTLDQEARLRVSISGTTFNGSAFNATSPWSREICKRANAWDSTMAEWGVANPAGVFTAKPEIEIDGGTADFELSMNVLFAN